MPLSLLGFVLQGLSPLPRSTGLITRRSPLGVFRGSPPQSVRRLPACIVPRRAPRGLCSGRGPYHSGGVLHPPKGRYPPGLFKAFQSASRISTRVASGSASGLRRPFMDDTPPQQRHFLVPGRIPFEVSGHPGRRCPVSASRPRRLTDPLMRFPPALTDRQPSSEVLPGAGPSPPPKRRLRTSSHGVLAGPASLSRGVRLPSGSSPLRSCTRLITWPSPSRRFSHRLRGELRPQGLPLRRVRSFAPPKRAPTEAG
jgi:hypothetical protein